jgi:hypothetical protein
MARPITIQEMTNLTEQTLEDALARFGSMWAVYVDYYHDDMSWRIGKIERWNGFKHDWNTSIIRIEYAQDELEAYTKAMDRLEQIK